MGRESANGVTEIKPAATAGRTAEIRRTTKETDILVRINLDGEGAADISTGVGFFDHMLNHIARHGFFDLEVKASGDLDVDCHHTIEDTGIALGQAISAALGNREGISRYASDAVPMEESLALCSLDISGRPYLAFGCDFTVPSIGGMDTEMAEEFFRAVCNHAGLNLHIMMLSGKNNHHMAEAIFKAFGRVLDRAASADPRVKGVLSTKGMF